MNIYEPKFRMSMQKLHDNNQHPFRSNKGITNHLATNLEYPEIQHFLIQPYISTN